MYIILFIAILILPALAQIGITTRYSKYSKVENSKNLSGFETARKILDANGLKDIFFFEDRLDRH